MPLLYLGAAQLCLFLAFLIAAIEPRWLVGFHYHPRMLAVVHLVTLGWITGSILGVLYLLFPLALRGRLEQDWRDVGAWVLFVGGVSGMVAHFWSDLLPGMVWAGFMALASILWVVYRVLAALTTAKLPPEVALHFRLACLNVVLAAAFGLVIGLDKILHFLPGYHLARVWAHAHLAAVGWATMMVVAAAYRLLPMLLPSRMPTGRWVWASAVVLETGVLLLTVGLVVRAWWTPGAALVVLAGLAIFAGRLVWMRRNRLPAPPALRRPDLGLWHVASALACFALACVLGVVILVAPPTVWKMKTILAYGVLGLVGGLAQMIVGISARLMPLFTYLRGRPGSEPGARLPSPHELVDRRLQVLVLAAWTVGVPVLAAGFAADSVPMVRGAGVLLAAAVALDFLHRELQRVRSGRAAAGARPAAQR